MTYKESILRIVAAEKHYYALCDLAETDDVIGKALENAWKAKAEHRAHFGSLHKINGEWV